MTIHDFQEKLEKGRRTELAVIDFLLADGYVVDIIESPREQKYRGDLRVYGGSLDKPFTIEVKDDSAALRTGNVFVEYISVDNQGKPGWALTTNADRVFYVIGNIAYPFKPRDLRNELPKWLYRLQTRKARNRGYNGWGVLVPVEVFKQVCGDPIDLSEFLD